MGEDRHVVAPRGIAPQGSAAPEVARLHQNGPVSQGRQIIDGEAAPSGSNKGVGMAIHVKAIPRFGDDTYPQREAEALEGLLNDASGTLVQLIPSFSKDNVWLAVYQEA